MTRFYVYELIDPRDGVVFYVGKGQGSRMYQHAAQAKKPGSHHNQRKIERIRAIQFAGLEPHACVVARFVDEADAFAHEADLIATRRGLTNILARGGGWSLSPDEFERRVAERATAAAARQTEKNKDYLRAWLGNVVARFPQGMTFPGFKDGDAKAAEFISDVRELLSFNSKIQAI